MGRHSKLEHREVALEFRRVHGSGTQGSFQILAAVQPLSAGCDLDALEQKIETGGGTGRTPGRGIEWPGGQREAENEQGGDSGLPARPFAELALGFRIEVIC